MTTKGFLAGNYITLAAIILLSRIPFLFAGYGSEEDAWGLILTARNISLSGTYEVSRLPGHPLQELFLSLIWHFPWWLVNLLTAIVSTTGIIFFVRALRGMNIKNALPAAAFTAFVPVFYVNSSNIMDYTWAVALVLIAFHQLHFRNILIAGIFIGLAAGFRVTAAASIIPFAILLWQDEKRTGKIILLGISAFITSAICYLPPLFTYGTEFFTFYEYFPYPPFLKNIYKGTIGAWGVLGFLGFGGGIILSLLFYHKHRNSLTQKEKLLILASLSGIILYSYSFLRIPQKSAFIIPMLPFIAIIFAVLLTKKQMIFLSGIMIVSCFFAGIQLDDPIRGSKSSFLSFKMKAGNTPVVFDLLNGPVTGDLSKRKLKMSFAQNVVDSLAFADEKKVIIAGWWQNELKYFSLQKPNEKIIYLYYADEAELRQTANGDAKIYYLPEQDYYNDLRFKKTFTRSLAEPL